MVQSVAVLAIAVCAFFLWRISVLVEHLVRASNAHGRFLETALLAEYPLENPNHSEPKSLVEEMRNHLWLTREELKRLRGAVRYIQSYVWQIQDPRTLAEILEGEESAYWSRTFRTPEAESFELWKREDDWDYEFHRDMASAPRSDGAPDRAESEDES